MGIDLVNSKEQLHYALIIASYLPDLIELLNQDYTEVEVSSSSGNQRLEIIPLNNVEVSTTLRLRETLQSSSE